MFVSPAPADTNGNDSYHRYYRPQFEAIAERLMQLKDGSPAYISFVDEMKENANKMLQVSNTVLFEEIELKIPSSSTATLLPGCARKPGVKRRMWAI